MIPLFFAFTGALLLLLLLLTNTYSIIFCLFGAFLLSWVLSRKFYTHKTIWDLFLILPGLICVAYLWINPTNCSLVGTKFLTPILLIMFLASYLGGKMGLSKLDHKTEWFLTTELQPIVTATPSYIIPWWHFLLGCESMSVPPIPDWSENSDCILSFTPYRLSCATPFTPHLADYHSPPSQGQ